jgi:hypothetical protein
MMQSAEVRVTQVTMIEYDLFSLHMEAINNFFPEAKPGTVCFWTSSECKF